MDREVKECVRLAEAAIEHLRRQKHSPYAVGILNKLHEELLGLEQVLQAESEEE